MPRRPVIRDLPDLAGLTAQVQKLPAGANRSETVGAWLRRTALRAQRQRPRVFYSIREVSAAAGLHPSGIATVYARLEAEGLLVRVRGSQTLIAPRIRGSSRGRHRIVALPVWLPGLAGLPDWRLFFTYLQDELSRHGAVGDFILVHPSQSAQPVLVERIKMHHPDVVFWLEPHPVTDRQSVQLLADAGLPVITVRDRLVPLAGHGYWSDREPAYTRGLWEWKETGIRTVLLPRLGDQPLSVLDPQLAAALATVGLRVEFPPIGTRSLRVFLRGLGRRRTGVIWEELMTFNWVCSQVPQAMIALYRNTRVMLPRSRHVWPGIPADVRVDALHFDCRGIAQRIARDLASGAVFRTHPPPILEWQWRSRITAAEALAEGDGL